MYYRRKEIEMEDGVLVTWKATDKPIHCPDSSIMTVENHSEFEYTHYGFTWHDEPPQEYLDWKQEQENELNNNLEL